jgi:hypothetical protein
LKRWLWVLGLILLLPLTGWAAEINGDLILSGALNGCVATGTASAYVCAPSVPVKAYHTGTLYTFIAPATNTGVVTINYSGLGAKTLKKVIAGAVTDLQAGDITAGDPVVTMYDGTFLRLVSSPGFATRTIASGTLALATAAIGSAACGTVQTATATGALATDAMLVTFSANVTGVTGYTPATTGSLRVDTYLTANVFNLVVCNATLNPITPGAVSVNWRVVR